MVSPDTHNFCPVMRDENGHELENEEDDDHESDNDIVE
jgi:hypothetical protein